MRFETLAVLTLASLATANRKPNPWDPLDVRSLKKCQAGCIQSTLPKLGDGKFVILQTPNEYFCASPDLKEWLRDEVFPCGVTACGRKVKLYAKRGMKWLRNTCPNLTFTEAEFSQPAGQPAGGASAGTPAEQPGAEHSGQPAAEPAGAEDPEAGDESHDDNDN
ncbi:uncharacterized protein PpBr36_10457 [Pyricularia pennisetigena]|uniref:uncharacterized protein n=1 Tax=Pyricularia pennisetigena TaxID=1578925 RepID=UPI00114F5D43|nr:uncharacterized protein PpBr36_10457 [Pyricularia pennisetigena]TLS21057.1 hypothetical protein PpBr36_10457 [Pyricularia pennisetigena]